MARAAKKTTKSRAKPKFWVGLGASAGGLEALRGLARNLPANLPATYIVAQHMAPHHKSMLAEIIGREANIAVKDVTDKLIPKANTIYITPSNQNIVVEKNRLRLVAPSSEPGAPKPSVDTFFETLAEHKGDMSIGIILSGTGSDGSKGIVAVKKAGGITIVQDELTAKYASMPMVAMETGQVDLVMSPEEIGAQLSKIIKLPRDLDALKASPLSVDDTSELIQLLMDETKVNFRHYKTATFQRRVERRMAANNTTKLKDYLVIARGSSKEVQALFKDLLISVTSFFRDPIEFESLSSHIDDIVKAKPNQHIRIWVPGMATGEEAYSLAILFSESMLKHGAGNNAKLQIFATDIDSNAIEIARRGYYPQTALESVPEDLVQKYFDTSPSGYTVKKMLREKMVFSYHNIAQDPPFLKMDMISCRNLLIYFQANLQAEVFSRFHYSLVPHGLLFLGKSEALSASELLFSPAGNDKHIFFQRPSQERRAPRDVVYEKPSLGKAATAMERSATLRELDDTIEQMDSLIAGLGKSALLIDGNINIIKGYGALNDYIGLSEGLINTKATSLVKEPYKQDIQAALPGVIRNKQQSRGFTRTSSRNPEYQERTSIYPLAGGAGKETLALVVFEEWLDETPKIEFDDSDNSNVVFRQQITDLGSELAIAKAHLQQTVEELETANEELQALNEELQSSNEELQSTNEELETSNEELQSTNEELSTVNEELQVNSQQLSSVNQNLFSILENITIPILVVDRNLNITNFSGVAEAFFEIAPDLTLPHVGRCKSKPGYPNLIDALDKTLAQGEPAQWNIQEGSESATLKIIPYFSSSNELLGGIVIVNDNTEELRKARDELRLVLDSVPISILIRDEEGTILECNNATTKMIEHSKEELVGRNFYEVSGIESPETLRKRDRRVFESNTPFIDDTLAYLSPTGQNKWLRVSAFPAASPYGDGKALYAIAQDITKEYEVEAALQTSQERLRQAVHATKIGIWEWDISKNELYWSPEIFKILNLPEGHKFGGLNEARRRVHPDDAESVKTSRNNHFENKTPHHLQYRIKGADDRYVWVEVNGQATWNDENEVTAFVGTLRDVTTERELLWSLKERKEHLELAAELSGVGYWKIDLTKESVFWSDQIHKIHGTSPDEYAPDLETAIQFYHPDDLEVVQNKVEVTLENGRPFELEARIIRTDGEERTVRSIGAPDIDEAGNTVAVFGVFQDITDEKAKEISLNQTLEELARSNEELNRFSYVCSHDLKEPVRMIESMSALLVDPSFKADDARRGDLLSRISTNTTRLRGIIDSLLAYSRIDAKIEVEKVDLNVVLAEIQDGLNLIIEESSATVKVGKLPTVHGASVHFAQLFQNLIGNALKFTDKKKPVIHLTSNKTEEGWSFLLEDNGPGIPKESRQEIFNIFSRLQRRDEVEGTGLGLSIAQRIVAQYRGSIHCCDSALGGVGFEIFIPFSENQND